MKVVLVTSKMRPGGTPDVLVPLVEALIDAGHELAPMVGESDDPIARYARDRNWPWLNMHPLLGQPRRAIAKALSQGSRRAEFEMWLSTIAQFQPDVGVALLTGWIPGPMMSAPRLGFINFHPGALPQTRGIEPESFAILTGDYAHGTAHVMTAEFDEGNILATTRPVLIEETDCPLHLLRKLSLAAPEAILEAMGRLSRGETGEPQTSWDGPAATLENLRRALSIRLGEISAPQLKRAIQSCRGHALGMRVNSVVGGQYLVFDPAVVVEGCFPGHPGQIYAYEGDHVGDVWAGAKIFRIDGGVLVAQCTTVTSVQPSWTLPSLLDKPFIGIPDPPCVAALERTMGAPLEAAVS
jgi:methionyl-tRNA formyltransferase